MYLCEKCKTKTSKVDRCPKCDSIMITEFPECFMSYDKNSDFCKICRVVCECTGGEIKNQREYGQKPWEKWLKQVK